MDVQEPCAPADIDFRPRTALGQRLWDLRRQAVAAGEQLLDWDELVREVASRRGGDADAGREWENAAAQDSVAD